MGMLSFIGSYRHRRHVRRLVRDGLRMGKGVHIGPSCFIDPAHCSLITLEDGACLGPCVMIFAHDASMKKVIGYTRIGRVIIGANAFVGAGTVILPGTTIGENSVVAAGSVVTRDVPPCTVAMGNPARIVCDLASFRQRHLDHLSKSRLEKVPPAASSNDDAESLELFATVHAYID